MRPRPNEEAGVTLVELAVVIFLMGLLAALATPSVMRSVRDNEVRKSTRNLAEVFHEFRGEASSSGRAMNVYVEGTQGSTVYRVMAWASPDATCSASVPDAADFCAAPTTVPEEDFLYLLCNDDAGAGDVAIVPRESDGAIVASIQRCIKPDGRLYDADGTAATGTMAFFVEGTRNTSYGATDDGTFDDYMVSVGINSLARIYRPDMATAEEAATPEEEPVTP